MTLILKVEMKAKILMILIKMTMLRKLESINHSGQNLLVQKILRDINKSLSKENFLKI
jgi:hypothetical protein